jgi:hypothetical protein
MTVFTPRERLVAVLCCATLVAALLSACGKKETLTLRGAEDMARSWLAYAGDVLVPPPPPPKPAKEKGKHKNDEDEEEETEPQWPTSLRDCFVDDGWDPQGFKNPTEAVTWLTAGKRRPGKVLSIELNGEGAQMTFELLTPKPVRADANVVMEDGWPKCRSLKVATPASPS